MALGSGPAATLPLLEVVPVTRALARLVVLSLAIAAGATAGAALWQPAGASTVDGVYTTVAPCVLFDSRATQGASGGFLGPINGGQAVTYLAWETFPAGQGGGNTECGIPKAATALEINVVAINALGEGNLRVTDGSPGGSGGVVSYNALTPKLNTANAVIVPLDDTGHLVVTPNCGAGCSADSTDIRGVVLGYFTEELAGRTTATEAAITSLQTQVNQLQTLLLDVTRIPAGVGGKDTLRFSGMNVQIVDGSNSTPCTDGTGEAFDTACNGEGNLVVGYAENDLAHPRSGSHNIVGGADHGWSSYGGAVFGSRNQITNDGTTVTGGILNTASGVGSSVSGGRNNAATGASCAEADASSSVSGGSYNQATGCKAAVSGGGGIGLGPSGEGNLASARFASVTGGQKNAASGGTAATVSGGYLNASIGFATSVSGGQSNTASSFTSSISGGEQNTANGMQSSISGGRLNTAAGTSSSISGGYSNTANGGFSSVSGGTLRTAAGLYDWWGGGLFQEN